MPVVVPVQRSWKCAICGGPVRGFENVFGWLFSCAACADWVAAVPVEDEGNPDAVVETN